MDRVGAGSLQLWSWLDRRNRRGDHTSPRDVTGVVILLAISLSALKTWQLCRRDAAPGGALSRYPAPPRSDHPKEFAMFAIVFVIIAVMITTARLVAVIRQDRSIDPPRSHDSTDWRTDRLAGGLS